MLYWLPCLAGLAIYYGWRIIYLPQTLVTDPNSPVLVQEILKSPPSSIFSLARTVYEDIGYLLGSAWTQAFSPDAVNLLTKTPGSPGLVELLQPA